MKSRTWNVSTAFESWDVVDLGHATKAELQAALSRTQAVCAMRAAIDGDRGPQTLSELHAGALGHLISRALAAKHVREEFLHLVEHGRVLVIARRSAEGAEADVVVVAALGYGEDTDRNIVADTELVARCLHGTGALLRWVSAADDIAIFLRGFRSIRRLVFMTHGSPGCIRVWDSDRSLSRYAKQMEGANLRCAEVVFEGCHVGEGGDDVVAFMQAVRAETATGYTGYHAWGKFTVPTVRKEDPAEVEGQQFYKRTRRFFVAGQPGAAELVRHPGVHQQAIEFFCRDRPLKDNILEKGTDSEVARLFDRSQLGRLTYRANETARMTKQFRDGRVPDRVEIEDGAFSRV